MRIGPFVIGRRLGRGGMAEVFGGRHEGQGGDVAVKLLRVHVRVQLATSFFDGVLPPSLRPS